MDSTVVEKIIKEIEGHAPSHHAEHVGVVTAVGDGVVAIDGLSKAVMSEVLEFEEAKGKSLEESMEVAGKLLGRVVSALGEPVDGKGPFKNPTMMAVERQAAGVIDRKSVSVPLATGIVAIDAMIPIGRGQRELIIGDRATGKTTVAIGQKESKTARIVEQLRQEGALGYTIIVDAPASAPAALQFLAPFAGVAIGEYFMDAGRDVLIIYDDLSKQAVAYRELSLLLRRPPGREAYPGDIFYLHSRLLERACRLNEEKGGGSITALPIIETQEGDVSAYIPTNVISITDGQMFLVTDLFNKGIRPAIDVGISVSRVGSSAQTKGMKGVAGGLKLELAQFRELEAFMQFASDLDKETADRIESGRRMVEVLKQKNGQPIPVEKQVATLYAANNKFFLDVPVGKVVEAEKLFSEFLDGQYAKLLAGIRKTGQLSDDAKKEIAKAMDEFRLAHKELFSA